MLFNSFTLESSGLSQVQRLDRSLHVAFFLPQKQKATHARAEREVIP